MFLCLSYFYAGQNQVQQQITVLLKLLVEQYVVRSSLTLNTLQLCHKRRSASLHFHPQRYLCHGMTVLYCGSNSARLTPPTWVKHCINATPALATALSEKFVTPKHEGIGLGFPCAVPHTVFC